MLLRLAGTQIDRNRIFSGTSSNGRRHLAKTDVWREPYNLLSTDVWPKPHGGRLARYRAKTEIWREPYSLQSTDAWPKPCSRSRRLARYKDPQEQDLLWYVILFVAYA
ncbi:hypothetical protein DPMN_158765 [Dreissena polymorpha]|uniref:Uncharacterized protein n=1 Tax=Dreissena polymorpha TaxID=45954 RepID=A0A9D4EJJ7_DREPO|nr:hypothetical protein DPMN_158765 [Dreissena polymorpha]